MHPFERRSPDLPPGVSSHLNTRLKPGWRFDRRRCALVSTTGQTIRLKPILPRGAKVLLTAPIFAKADQQTLSEDESVLARSLQVVLPAASKSPDSELSKLAGDLSGLEGVEAVSSGPRLGLP